MNFIMNVCVTVLLGCIVVIALRMTIYVLANFDALLVCVKGCGS